MKFLRNILLLVLMSGTTFHLNAQSIEETESEIRQLFSEMHKNTIKEKQDSISMIIKSKLEYCFSLENSFQYNFDSLRFLSKLSSDDKKLKVYSWDIAYSDGTFKHFGFLRYNKKKEIINYFLNDESDSIKNPGNVVLNPKFWYGALYYKIITKKYKKQTQYILLGWDGNTIYSNKKIIDVLYFNNTDEAVFGAPILAFENNQIKNRIIFEYAEQVSMMLRYDDEIDMIVWDHLSPPRSSLTGQYQFYGPDFSYDGLFFNRGRWDYYSDLNIKRKN